MLSGYYVVIVPTFDQEESRVYPLQVNEADGTVQR